jgi:hypothetical protein
LKIKGLRRSEWPLSVKLSVKRVAQTQLARIRQYSTETRPLLVNASDPDGIMIQQLNYETAVYHVPASGRFPLRGHYQRQTDQPPHEGGRLDE